jgi:predicted dehydrogenase
MRIGMAGIASLYWPVAIARGLRARKDVELLAATSLGVRARTVKELLGMSAEKYAQEFALVLYDDVYEMLERERLDTVVLNVCHSEHARWAERLARRGVNVYIPKTFATTAAEATRIVRAAKQHGVQVACGPSDRFMPAMLAAKRAVDKRLIGRLLSMRVAHHHGTLEVFHKNDWYRNAREGGPELSLGWYVVDLAMHFTESRARSVFAHYENYTTSKSPFMDCGKMFLAMESGAMVSCDMYFCNRFAYPVWELEVIGARGAVKVFPEAGDPYALTAVVYTDRGARKLALPRNAPDREVAWVNGFKEGSPAVVSAERAREITLVSLAARESARKGRRVQLPR